jgi:hypothetical protein
MTTVFEVTARFFGFGGRWRAVFDPCAYSKVPRVTLRDDDDSILTDRDERSHR